MPSGAQAHEEVCVIDYADYTKCMLKCQREHNFLEGEEHRCRTVHGR